jgi:hypothetical protein
LQEELSHELGIFDGCFDPVAYILPDKKFSKIFDSSDELFQYIFRRVTVAFVNGKRWANDTGRSFTVALGFGKQWQVIECRFKLDYSGWRSATRNCSRLQSALPGRLPCRHSQKQG